MVKVFKDEARSSFPLCCFFTKLTAVSRTAFVNPALYFLLFDENLLAEKRPVYFRGG